MTDGIKRLFLRSAKLVLQPYYRQVRGTTLGTRTLVLRNGDREVLLVRHGYAAGWLLPGGGVERGEVLAEAAVRELREEAGIEAAEEPRLHGIFNNDKEFPGDYVACYVLRNFRQGSFTPGFEIAEAKFFPADALPEGATAGTRRRIAEVLGGHPASARW